MPSITENKAHWDGEYHWRDAGDEWSADWGGPSMQWYGSILPRIHQFVPANTILEIACGYGRWTQFLKDLCRHLIVVDLSERCVRACQERFASCSHITYFVNDGKSLAMVAGASVDLVFSFDSLVHVDQAVMQEYLAQLPRILTEGGAAFLHHSNLGDYAHYERLQRIPMLHRLLSRLGLVEPNLHSRDLTVTAKKVERLAEERGLDCIGQELITWRTKRALIDCLSTIVKGNSPWARENRVLRNSAFTQEMAYLARLSRLYSSG